jgi:peroxiredoxin
VIRCDARRLGFASAASLLLVGCSDSHVKLYGADDLELAYDCAQPEAVARTDAERSLVREYAINAVRDARNRDALSDAEAIISAEEPAEIELALVRYMCTHGDVRAASRRIFPESGSAAEDIELPHYSAQGPAVERFRLEEYRGSIVVLNFWATWCAPCVEELPELHSIAERYRESGVVVFSVLHQDHPERAAEFLRTLNVNLPLLIDRDERVAQRYRVRGLPFTFIIDRQGKVFHAWPGYGGAGTVERLVREALESEPAA